MSTVLEAGPRGPVGQPLLLVRCAGCARIYETRAVRTKVERLACCAVCKPKPDGGVQRGVGARFEPGASVHVDQKTIARFFEKTCPEPNTGCLLWTAYLDRHGYGTFYFLGISDGAHRIAFVIAHGRWPNTHALHHCDTPACVNAAHLFEGTQAHNLRDMFAKGRGYIPSGDERWGRA